MKNLNNYIVEHLEYSTFPITERLHINKDSKPGIDLDNLIDQNITLYDDTKIDADDDRDVLWDDCERELANFNDVYDYYILFKFNSMMKSKEIAAKNDKIVEPIEIFDDLNGVKDYIITGKDAGYAVRLVGGHIEIDCINSGSRATYYIYALTPEGYDRLSAFLEGDESEPNIDFLYTNEDQKYIIPIE